MRRIRGFVFTLVTLGLAGAVAAAVFVYRPDPFAQPGQTWSNNGLTAGQDIRLLDSGEYIARTWCDVCKGKTSIGTWSRTGALVTLDPAEPGKPNSVLRNEIVLGCQLLAPVNVPAASGVLQATFVRQGDTCQNSL